MNETESTADRRPGGAWRLFYGLLKTACILGGLPVTVICLMAVVGLLTGNGWIQLIAGTVVAVGLPLFVVDRLLPDDDQQRAKGLTTDVLALIWAGFAVAFVGGGHAVTSGWLAREGDRRAAAGQQTIARLDYWLAAVRPVRRTPAKPLAGGSGRGTARAGAGTARRGGAGSGTGSSAAKPDAGPAFDARADATKARPDARADSRVPAKKTKLTPAEIFRQAAPAVVSVRLQHGGGTGFFVNAHGMIATNHHVVRNASHVQIKLKDGSVVREVELLIEDKKADLALLKIRPPKLVDPLPLGDSDKITIGEAVLAIGNPLGLEHTLTDGIVSQRRIYRGRKWIQMSTPISPGNSGGPLINRRGEVVGVNTAGFAAWTGAQNLNLAVPINELKRLMKGKDGKFPKRRQIGSDKPQSW